MASTNVPAKTDPTDMTELIKLFNRAASGDEKVLPTLRAVLKEPFVANMLGNLAKFAIQPIIDRLSGKDLGVREGLLQKMENMRTDLAGPTPVPLEQLLADRIVTCWLHLHDIERTYALKGSMSLDLATYYQKSIDRAQKRYLTAIKSLAAIRKMALPVLQVNIAKKQVNVAGNCTATEAHGKADAAGE